MKVLKRIFSHRDKQIPAGKMPGKKRSIGDPLFETEYKFVPIKTFRKFTGASDIKIPYIFADRKKKETLVFIHGWALSLSSWKYQMHRFPEYNLLFINNRGHGNVPLAESTPQTYLYDCAKDVVDLMAHLHISDAHIISHSMGSLISAIVYGAELHKSKNITNIHSMIFVAPVVINPLNTFPLRDIAGFLKDKYFIKLITPKHSKILELMFTPMTNRFPLKLLHTYFRLITQSPVEFDAFKKYVKSISHINPEGFSMAFHSMVLLGDQIGELMKEINIPSLVITGQRDFFVSPIAARILKERLNGNVNLHVYEKMTHFPQAEGYKTFNKDLYEFLKSFNQSSTTNKVDEYLSKSS